VQLNKWTVKAGLYASKSDFVNPTFLNYEIRDERNLGGRATAQYAFQRINWKGKLTFGVEHQYFRSPIVDYSTNKGFAGSKVLSSDKIYSRQNLFFLQGDFDLPYNFIVTAGASGTLLQYEMLHYQDSDNGVYATPPDQTRNFDPVFSPRIALLKKITPTHSVYTSVSYGFSPPSVAEVRPSTNAYNNALNPEHGTNYEIGFKGQIPRGSLRYNVNLYEFDLKETIVIQRTPDNADFFINAGSTRQRGAEVSVTWAPNLSTTGIVTAFALQGNYTANHFYFEKYVNNEVDYSGNRLTGVAPNVAAFGMDVQLINKFYANITTNYVDKIPLNDGNSVYAPEYYIFGARIGYKTPQPATYPVEVFAGADNLFDRKYSLGNDLNAAGGRFFNAASGRNFYVGLKINALFSK
jgi:iron complex outermembrane receptor protein